RTPNQLPVSRGRSERLPPQVAGTSTGCAPALPARRSRARPWSSATRPGRRRPRVRKCMLASSSPLGGPAVWSGGPPQASRPRRSGLDSARTGGRTMGSPERKLGDIADRIVFENERVRIWELHLAPGEKGPVHRHALDHILIQIDGDRVAVHPEPDTVGP